MRNYQFRPLTPDDLPLMQKWLAEPHIRPWWGDVERNIALMKQDMENSEITMQVVTLGARPFAYLHHHDVRTFAMPQFGDLSPGTQVIKTFVGDTDFMGQGHAAGYLGAALQDLRRLHPMLATAPNATDARLIGIFTQAGFHKRRLAATRDGQLVQVMTHH